MKNEIIALINTNTAIAQKCVYSAVCDTYNSSIIDSKELLSILADENVQIVKSDTHYSVSNPNDKAKVYDRYGRVVKEVQKVIYTI